MIETPTKSYFKYKGDLVDFIFLCLKNLLLNIVSFGLYFAWSRTSFRKFLWSSTVFNEEAGEYTGTGEELFIGWIKLLGVLLLFLVVITAGTKVLSWVIGMKLASAIDGILTFAIYTFMFGIAIYSGLCYRMSRTRWHGISFGVERTRELIREFNFLYLKGLFFTFITVGFYYPYFRNNTHKFLIDRCRFGSAKFNYSGTGPEYFSLFIRESLLVLVTFGIYYPWFYCNTLKYRLQHTHFGNGKFDIEVSGTDLLVYGLSSYVLIIVTFGLATPWLLHWGFELFINKINFDGTVDLSSIQAVHSDGSAMADDIVVGYDLDFGF